MKNGAQTSRACTLTQGGYALSHRAWISPCFTLKLWKMRHSSSRMASPARRCLGCRDSDAAWILSLLFDKRVPLDSATIDVSIPKFCSRSAILDARSILFLENTDALTDLLSSAILLWGSDGLLRNAVVTLPLNVGAAVGDGRVDDRACAGETLECRSWAGAWWCRSQEKAFDEKRWE